jgi:Domain of unknown function (DUF5916)/Carbohydrate family 9 binding domain-like
MKNTTLTILLAFWQLTILISQTTPQIPKKQYTTQSIGTEQVRLDGVLDEPIWKKANWGGDFIEYQPEENTAPSQKTQFCIVYDEKFLYVGYRCFDTALDSIVRRMGRRDEFPGDWVELNIDSYHDQRTAFSFTISASGVRGDEFISDNGGNWDDSWNPIWYAKTDQNADGWTAEIKIPFSQLRYGNQTEPVWGFEVQRLLFRKQERSYFQYIPQSGGGWVSFFAELNGLRNLPTNRQVELAPYLVAQTEHFEAEAGNPYADGSVQKVNAGLDGKVGITRDIMLDFTINPDFGQVEADLGAIRLDGYEVFFEERRPFFIESRNLFDYRLTGSEAGGDYDSDLLFYSRRIGGAPHGSVSTNDGEFAKIPSKTSILGAAKISGKTKNGVSLGLMETVTQREQARITGGNENRKTLVEPMTHFMVGRLLKDFDEGKTVIGGVFTSVNRRKGLPLLHSNAFSGGFDWQHYWKNRFWYFKGNVLLSHVRGSKEAILETQTGFVHHFQRSNATHLEVNGNRTSLTGSGGTLRLGKTGGKPSKNGGIFKFESGATWRSPELELNDIGYLQAADEINHFTWAGYQRQKPFGPFLSGRINYNHFMRWDFGGQFLYTNFNTNMHGWFKNNWKLGTGFNYSPINISNNALRGGSSLRSPNLINNWAYMETDERKKVSFSVRMFHALGLGNIAKVRDYAVGIQFQPLNALQISLSPSYGRTWRKQDQYVAETTWQGQQRSIVSEVNQQNISLTTRLSYNISPTFTVQFYGEPFLFRAKYDNYGVVTDPLNRDFNKRFRQFETTELTNDSNGEYMVDENGDGATDYRFGKPDFNYVQFRGNLVLRWEYISGSELFLVWSQNNTPNAFDDLNTPVVESLWNNAFDEKPYNIFLVKATYRFLK